MSLVGEHETAQPGCSQQYAMVLGFPETVQWTKLSPRAWQQGGTLNAGEGWASSAGDVELHVPSQAEAPRYLLEYLGQAESLGPCNSFTSNRLQEAV